MQLEDGGRRRPSGTSHNALKVSAQGRRAPPRHPHSRPSLSLCRAMRPAPEAPGPASRAHRFAWASLTVESALGVSCPSSFPEFWVKESGRVRWAPPGAPSSVPRTESDRIEQRRFPPCQTPGFRVHPQRSRGWEGRSPPLSQTGDWELVELCEGSQPRWTLLDCGRARERGCQRRSEEGPPSWRTAGSTHQPLLRHLPPGAPASSASASGVAVSEGFDGGSP